ncbi:MarR family winged helix-turn-helix transcriptional regulator [Maricaulis sp.]|jgi:DNA-binding MarR family transcriptional regulator|uniref:MarR family winged helix-turn-helix transcriptional regulator n=1 Tax=Maricaulis sp. TaxID=1486257 RepID=UPI00262E2D21|nr:MarR family winged helix-turn-helix transcriptional regulator [Maricaulis sp.]
MTHTARTPDTQELRLRDYMPYRLAVTSNLVSRLIASAYQARFGISIWEWRVIAILGEGQAMTAQAIADSAAMDKVSVSRAVRSLVERGLVEREDHASDRRARLLRLSAAGADTYGDIAPVALAEEAALLAEFSPEEAELLAGLLGRLRRRAGQLMHGDGLKD